MSISALIAVFAGLALSRIIGRKKMMLASQAFLTVTSLIIVFALKTDLDGFKVAMVMTYTFGLMFGMLPAGLTYICEITGNKATAFAISVFWFWVVTIALANPSILHLGFNIFVFPGFNTVSFLFLYLMIKDTWGKTLRDTRKIYSKSTKEEESSFNDTKIHGQEGGN